MTPTQSLVAIILKASPTKLAAEGALDSELSLSAAGRAPHDILLTLAEALETVQNAPSLEAARKLLV